MGGPNSRTCIYKVDTQTLLRSITPSRTIHHKYFFKPPSKNSLMHLRICLLGVFKGFHKECACENIDTLANIGTLKQDANSYRF